MQPIFKKYIATVAAIWAICFFLLVMAYIFVLVPQDKELEIKGKELAASDVEFKKAVEADSEETRTKLANRLSLVSEKVGNYAISIDAASKLAFEIGLIASELGVKEFACSVNGQEMVTSVTDCNGLGMMSIAVNFKSSFNKFVMFVNKLERSRPVIFVDRFSIDHSTVDDDSHQVTMVIKVMVSKIPFQSHGVPVKVVSAGNLKQEI